MKWLIKMSIYIYVCVLKEVITFNNKNQINIQGLKNNFIFYFIKLFLFLKCLWAALKGNPTLRIKVKCGCHVDRHNRQSYFKT